MVRWADRFDAKIEMSTIHRGYITERNRLSVHPCVSNKHYIRHLFPAAAAVVGPS